MSDLGIKVHQLSSRTALVEVEGHLDYSTFDKLEDAVQELFKNGTCRLIFSLAKLTYMSSSGVGILIGARTTSIEKKGNMVILEPLQDNVRDVIEVLGLMQVFHFADNLRSAHAILKKVSK